MPQKPRNHNGFRVFLYPNCFEGFVFCTHYSLDGENFYMVRLFHLPVEKTVKVGIEDQSPAGEGGLRFYSHITLENKTVKNMRAGK